MNYWAWGGKYIGHRSGDVLYHKSGTPIGRFFDAELYDFSGRYLAEVRSDNRLIVHNSKRCYTKSASSKPSKMAGTSYSNYVGYVMYAGYDDFIWGNK